jgi:hypothetical protein
MQLLLTTKRHFHFALWMPVTLFATIPASLNGCGGPWWDVSACALNLIQKILNTYYKSTLSAITIKSNVSGHMLMWNFSLFWYMLLMSKFWRHLCICSISLSCLNSYCPRLFWLCPCNAYMAIYVSRSEYVRRKGRVHIVTSCRYGLRVNWICWNGLPLSYII